MKRTVKEIDTPAIHLAKQNQPVAAS